MKQQPFESRLVDFKFDDMENSCSSKYVYDPKHQYTLPDFYQKYGNQLPLLVIVTEGFSGRTAYDELSTNQVIWLHRVVHQIRAIGRLANQANRKHEEFVSIPVCSSHMFSVVKNFRNESYPETLELILSRNKLPVQVRLVTGDDEFTMRTLRRYNMLILNKYTETYLKGNCLQDDILLPLPLLLALSPNISIAIVTGYRDGSKENFKRKIESLNAFVNTNVGLKVNEGCKEITLFDKQYSTTGTGNCVPIHLLPNLDEVIYHEIETDPYWIPPKPCKRRLKPPLPARRPEGWPDLVRSQNESEKQLSESKTMGNNAESGQSSSACSIQSYVSDMSVNDIQHLLEAFNLSKYQQDFKKHLIDGAMLEGLGEDILRDDFKFKQVEVVRLMKFIREGHIPKQRN